MWWRGYDCIGGKSCREVKKRRQKRDLSEKRVARCSVFVCAFFRFSMAHIGRDGVFGVVGGGPGPEAGWHQWRVIVTTLGGGLAGS